MFTFVIATIIIVVIISASASAAIAAVAAIAATIATTVATTVAATAATCVDCPFPLSTTTIPLLGRRRPEMFVMLGKGSSTVATDVVPLLCVTGIVLLQARVFVPFRAFPCSYAPRFLWWMPIALCIISGL
jgi:hypothetical protein